MSPNSYLDPRLSHRPEHIKKTFPIITTYNPEEAKITMKSFSLSSKCFFHVFSGRTQKHQKYIFSTIMWRKVVIASQHSYHSTALQLIRLWLQQHRIERKTYSMENFFFLLRFELIFEDFPLEYSRLLASPKGCFPLYRTSYARNSLEINKFYSERFRLRFLIKNFSNKFLSASFTLP